MATERQVTSRTKDIVNLVGWFVLLAIIMGGLILTLRERRILTTGDCKSVCHFGPTPELLAAGMFVAATHALLNLVRRSPMGAVAAVACLGCLLIANFNTHPPVDVRISDLSLFRETLGFALAACISLAALGGSWFGFVRKRNALIVPDEPNGG
jgi:hypothetical protein